MNSPVRWPGGKSRLADTIVSYLGEHVAYVEPCCGGAWVFWRKPREMSKSEILNDADGELINFYYELHKRGKRLLAEVDAMPYSRGLFSRMLAERPRSRFRRAVRFWYLDRVAFGAKQRGASYGVKVTGRTYVLPNRVLAGLDEIIERMRGVAFESVDVVRLLALYDRRTTLFYLDPPYYGLSQAYACQFGESDHARLATSLRAIKGSFLLSYNDCREVRRLYRGLHLKQLTTRYTIGSNARSAAAGSVGKELLISNRPLRRRKMEYSESVLSGPKTRN